MSIQNLPTTYNGMEYIPSYLFKYGTKMCTSKIKKKFLIHLRIYQIIKIFYWDGIDGEISMFTGIENWAYFTCYATRLSICEQINFYRKE